jgi:hypothetical protein
MFEGGETYGSETNAFPPRKATEEMDSVHNEASALQDLGSYD